MFMNRFYSRENKEDVFSFRTIADHITSFSKEIDKKMMERVKEILVENDFNPSSALPNNLEELPLSITQPDLEKDEYYENQLQEAIERYNSEHSEEFKLGNIDSLFIPEPSSSKAVYISVDDVLVKHQKEERNKPRSTKIPKNVSTTVIHVATEEKTYTISAIGMQKAFTILVAYLLENNLMENRQLVFLSDGATDIKKNIKDFFFYRPYVLILDWFHLAKRVKEFSSMAFKMKKDEP